MNDEDIHFLNELIILCKKHKKVIIPDCTYINEYMCDVYFDVDDLSTEKDLERMKEKFGL